MNAQDMEIRMFQVQRHDYNAQDEFFYFRTNWIHGRLLLTVAQLGDLGFSVDPVESADGRIKCYGER